MAFADTHHYKKTQPFNYKGETYWPISPFGDGNCGLYAFACGLIDSTISNELILEKEKFDEFRNIVVAFLYLASNNISEFKHELETQLYKFIRLICQSNLTFSKFKNSLIEHLLTREDLAAINLILGQGLRYIGVKSYKEICARQLGIQENLFKEDIQLFKTGEWIGQEILSPLAKHFGVQLKLISKNPNTDQYYHHESLAQSLPEKTPPLKKMPVVTLLFENGHWHWLISSKKKLGLTTILPSITKQPRIARELLHSNKKLTPPVKNDKQKSFDIKDKKNPSERTRRTSRELLHLNGELMQTVKSDKQKPFAFAKTTLDSLASRLKQVFDFLVTLKDIFNAAPNQTEELKKAKEQAKTVAQDSTQIINSWREKCGTSDQLDKQLNKLRLRDFEKSLLKTPLIMDNSEEDAMAAILQNAEIVDFLSRNHATLKTHMTPIPTNKPNMADHNQSVTAHDLRSVAPCISVQS
ncbi:hypothetical protein RVIR1_03840 [Candidatus Rickettsiella viridis]|uniref:Uncharacterized protein n=1 Tax=Candidatus Rickettsiella viridis TaxID=676208 RepID=A0A2Z5UTS0_9COXI|nr:hypothetical protein [Candidatus Rickettsiella viridis]BBB14899.1 hypothetical protein RVIR1_03840 [Candidatus Rickettsiella viridis]